MSGYVGVYVRLDGEMFVASYSKVASGPHVVNGWVQKACGEVIDDDLGRVVLEGLDQTEIDIPEVSREELARRQRPLLKLAGVTSYTRFATGVRHAGVSRDVAGALTITPSRNVGGRKGGFLYLPPDSSVVLRPEYDAHAVGQAVRKGLDRASSS
jgi:hypothetical protein